ncbi:hypothetical protein JHK87_034947 [Glycine soja]|nr:hypothetical protein JHK87_034947 [Glycine soja]
MAVQKLYPDAKVTIGPWIENGFYYDFDTEPLTDKDLKRSKKEMVMSGGTSVLERKPMLQRIYGTAWENEEQLKAYLHFKEEAKRRDHRRLGQDLDLFSIQDDAGGGLVFWHPNGAMVRHIIEDFWKKIHMKRGYDLLYTPHVAKADLWKISGHLDFCKENMYDQMSVEDELHQLRPMNCPYHILVYKSKLHSYRDFPIRVAELGTVYRYELSGSLHGLFRVRGFTQEYILASPGIVAPAAHLELGTFGIYIVDFNLPQRFDITYVDSNTEKRRPIMIHRAVLGSLERFFDILIEHYAGDFPLWLSPIQARVLPVTDAQLEYCNVVTNKLKMYGIRAEVCHGERLPKLIRNAEKQKIPLMAVVGSKEVETETVTVRSRFGGELGTMPVDDFINRIKLGTILTSMSLKNKGSGVCTREASDLA